MKQDEKMLGVILILTTCVYYYAVYTNKIEYSPRIALGLTITFCLAAISYALDKKNEPTKINLHQDDKDEQAG